MLLNLKFLDKSIAKLDQFWLNNFIYPNSKLIQLIDKKLFYLSQNEIIYPEKENIFASLSNLPITKIKVVILGQDPYHGENEAIGYSFAINSNNKIPPSLNNIYKELSLEYNIDYKIIKPTLLQDLWVNQGVLLLNSILTVNKDKPRSHANIGWEQITNNLIKFISKNTTNIVFLLWGKDAQKKNSLIDNTQKHLILFASHPSPFSAKLGFLGCNHFKQTNDFLITNNIDPIKWI
jgi:uracil-DNA glycosylase